MPTTVTYPGVYIEEIPSGVHTITGVATSITAFIGYTQRGLDNYATQIFSFADYERSFGELSFDSELSFAVQQFYLNGGTQAYVVRVPRKGSKPASVTLLDAVSGGSESLKVTMRSNGTWSDDVIIDVDYDGVSDENSFNLIINDVATGTIETFDDVTTDKTSSRFVEVVVNDTDSGSKLVMVEAAEGADPTEGADRPAATGITSGDITLGDLQGKEGYTIKLSVDAPESVTTDEFALFNSGDTAPGSIASLCRVLERQANAALAKKGSAATISCVASSSGKGVRVSAYSDDAPDAVVTFESGGGDSSPAMDADTFLNLVGQDANVSHYWPASQRETTSPPTSPPVSVAQQDATRGDDGTDLPGADELIGDSSKFTGIYALDKVDLFNILCIPDATRAGAGSSTTAALDSSSQTAVWSTAMSYCIQRRAFLLIDSPPDVFDVATAMDWKSENLNVHDKNGAAYFPRVKLADATNDFKLRSFAPCGVMAGLYARIDAARGVWKAPAGTEATLTGVQGMVYSLTDSENGVLNPLGLNCLRIFPVYGAIAWGARTLLGADADASEWKYVPIRRFALYLEESLYRGTKWVVFEPNDEPLWAQIRLNVGAFMHNLFRQGAFQGTTPSVAYFVKCDSETTTQTDIDSGIVNILVGFAPLKPAEFVIIKIQQMAGEIET